MIRCQKIPVSIIFLFSVLTYSTGSSQQIIRILPLGNSITEGYTDGTLTNAQTRGYRYGLKYILQHTGYNVDFVGSQSAGSAYFSDCQHAGIGGSRDQYIVRLLTDGYDERNGVQILVPPRPYLDEYNPDIILLEIGTNDITHEGSAAITDQKVSAILDLVDQYEIRAGKKVVVFLALIINRIKPWTPGSPAEITSSFNNAIKSMAQSRIAAGDNIVIVDMEHDAGFLYTSEDMSNDGEGLHPNDLGYSKMANLWYSSIFSNYNTAPVISPIPDQTISEGNNFTSLLLDNFVFDIQDPDQDISWTAYQSGTPMLNISINSDRQAIVIPEDPEWSGSQTVIFTATDKGRNGKDLKSVSDTVVYVITPVNDLPVIISDPLLFSHVGELYSYTLLANDVDNPVLTLSAVQIPSWLSFTAETGELSGIPAQSDIGQDLVVLQVSDGLSNTKQSFIITTIGESDINKFESAGIRIYPVPASDVLHVEFVRLSGKVSLEILNPISTVMRKLEIPADQKYCQIELKGIEPGNYFLHIKNNTISYICRFIILKP